jgi:hypothetical protein
MTALLVATLLVPSLPGRTPDEATIRLNDASVAFRAGVEARGDAARARQLFRDAADGFDFNWEAGDRSARLATNRGRSHFLAGNVPMAVAAFRAGLRETPYDVDLLRGLADCRAAIPYPTPSSPDEQLRPDPPSGWRHRVSDWDVFRLAVIAVSLIVVGLARRFTARDGWAVPVAVIGGIGTLACLIVGWKLDAERAAEAARPALVVTADTTLRKGNGFTHRPRIEATIPRGTEVTERTRRGGWAQVEVAGGAVGWLPESAVRLVK